MSCLPCQSPPAHCAPFNPCPPADFGGLFPTLVGPQGPPGGPGTFAATYALLRLLDPTAFPQGYIAQVGGRTAALDGGAGNFAYDATSVAADNDGTILAPASGVGRWIRVFSGPFDVEWFGAKGNASTDDSAAIQATIDAAVASIPFAGYAPGVAFKPSVYNIGAAAVALLISASVRIIGNGAQLSYTGTGIALKISGANAVTIRDLIVANPVFSFSNPASALVGTGVQILNSGFCNIYNLTTTGFAVGRDWYGNGQGVSYSNEFGAAVLHCGIGVRIRAAAAVGSYATHINYYGGSITTGTYASMVGTRGILIINEGGNSLNGINFYGTGNEGDYENKLRTDGTCCIFSGLYWDAPNGGTDIVFTASSADNIIISGNALGLQVTADAGARNIVFDPNLGIKAVLPINGKVRIYRLTDHGQYFDLDASAGNADYDAAGLNHVFKVSGTEVGKIGIDGKITAASGLVATAGDVVSAAGNLEATAGGVKTAAPTSGAARVWKLGRVVTNSTVLDTTRYLEVEVEGVAGLLRIGLVN